MGDDFLFVADIAAVDVGHIAAIPPLTTADLADFFGVHSIPRLKEFPGYYSTDHARM